jgi:arginine/ornithine transport system permease protein
MLGPFNVQLVWNSLPELGLGLVTTLQLTVYTVLLGLLVSVPLGILRNSTSRFVKIPIWAFTYFFVAHPCSFNCS